MRDEDKTCEELIEELTALRRRAVQADRLHALGATAAGVAHEISQPLNGIRTFAEGLVFAMKRGWEVTEEDLYETLADIIEQVDRITNILEHVRMFSGATSEGPPVPFPLSLVIENTFKLVGAQLSSRGIKVETDIPADLPDILGYPYEIEQVLLNLLANARDALDGRHQRMKASGNALGPSWRAALRVQAQVVPEQDIVRVSVADTAGGIPKDVLPRIFDPFFTTKGQKGTGLGLAISRNIAEKHGGRLEVDNRPGDGATFTLILPVAREEGTAC